ncbi:hypothetical protein [Pollutimonas sp. M17]|uniref:hypothetical protein n=1 Tax=Pollutimonas sp. M17 TaxID=2962065 RepID=UPI0021F3FB77|nr:hypothetical protein [Pollutimonas sp. M17]UYO92335.1 hypothetical protein OEG81_10410 [Pollutimonas sp. M17]
MTQNPKTGAPPPQDAEQGNEIDPRLKEPASPGQYRSGIDGPGESTSKNPGHANPAHNTPGHERQDEPGQHDPGQPSQGQTQSYPGIKGGKARALAEDEDMDRKQADETTKRDPRSELGLKSPVKEAKDTEERMNRQEAQGGKATQFDGSPAPQGSASTSFKPKDDTPAKLKKSEGPRNDQ